MKLLFPLPILLLFSLFVSGQTNAWRGLQPLYSSREDVEKLFGKPNPEKLKFVNEYEFPGGSLWVDYAGKKCGAGWSVAPDTVLKLRVSTTDTVMKSAEELKLSDKDFAISVDDAMYATWTDAVAGKQYYFMNGRMALREIRYIPRRIDNDRRCDGFPPFTPEGYHYTMESIVFHSSSRNKRDDQFDPLYRLDNSLLTLNQNYKTYRLFVLIYFDDKLSIREYRRRVAKLRNFAYVVRKASPEDVVFIEGGLREENLMEFYLLPRSWKPPAPDPTLPSPQFRKTSDKKAPKTLP